MPYNVETKDGIVVRNIPDDIPPDDPRVKEKVEAARASRATGQSPQTSPAEVPELAKKDGNIEEPSISDRYKYARASNTDLFENLETTAQVALGLPIPVPEQVPLAWTRGMSLEEFDDARLIIPS